MVAGEDGRTVLGVWVLLHVTYPVPLTSWNGEVACGLVALVCVLVRDTDVGSAVVSRTRLGWVGEGS